MIILYYCCKFTKSDYYQNVCNEKNIDVEITQTQSNGKPGMGHNSLFKIFYEKTQFDYDFSRIIYPYALHQLIYINQDIEFSIMVMIHKII